MVDLITHRAGRPPGCGLVSPIRYELSTNDKDSQRATPQKGRSKASVPIRFTHALVLSEKL